jgi:hypothetical protein
MEQYVSPRRAYLSTSPHGVTAQSHLYFMFYFLSCCLLSFDSSLLLLRLFHLPFLSIFNFLPFLSLSLFVYVEQLRTIRSQLQTHDADVIITSMCTFRADSERHYVMQCSTLPVRIRLFSRHLFRAPVTEQVVTHSSLLDTRPEVVAFITYNKHDCYYGHYP